MGEKEREIKQQKSRHTVCVCLCERERTEDANESSGKQGRETYEAATVETRIRDHENKPQRLRAVLVSLLLHDKWNAPDTGECPYIHGGSYILRQDVECG